MATHLATNRLAERFRLAALTLGLPIIAVALFPVVVVGMEKLASMISGAVGQPVSPLQIALIAAGVAYTLYKIDTADWLESGFSAIISVFVAAGLLPVVRSAARVSEGVFTYVGLAALLSLVASDVVRHQGRTS